MDRASCLLLLQLSVSPPPLSPLVDLLVLLRSCDYRLYVISSLVDFFHCALGLSSSKPRSHERSNSFLSSGSTVRVSTTNCWRSFPANSRLSAFQLAFASSNALRVLALSLSRTDLVCCFTAG